MSKALRRRCGVRVVSNRVRVTAFERTYGVPGGEKPRRENPTSGTGMKQARQVVRGARRRRVEKTQGRNITREVEAHGEYVAPRGWQNAEGEETSEGVGGLIRRRESENGPRTVAYW
jgi:hypothetical protein